MVARPDLKNSIYTPERLWAYYHMDLQLVEAELQKILASQGNLISEIGDYILKGGGKRIRPLLAIIISKLHADKPPETALISLATALEMVHTASLLHDDVIDNAARRRGKDAARLIWGNKASILVGDHLYAQGVSLAESLQDHSVTGGFLSACRKMTAGETLQLSHLGDLEMTEEIYLQIIEYKTAALISEACRLSAIVSKIDVEKQEAIAQFGFNIGLAYQIVDDALDYVGDGHVFGKNVCKDLRDGGITLPLLHLLSRCGRSERDLVSKIIGLEKISRKKILEILNLIKEYKSVEYSMEKARQLIGKSKKHLALYPDSIHRRALFFLADYVISRVY